MRTIFYRFTVLLVKQGTLAPAAVAHPPRAEAIDARAADVKHVLADRALLQLRAVLAALCRDAPRGVASDIGAEVAADAGLRLVLAAQAQASSGRRIDC